MRANSLTQLRRLRPRRRAGINDHRPWFQIQQQHWHLRSSALWCTRASVISQTFRRVTVGGMKKTSRRPARRVARATPPGPAPTDADALPAETAPPGHQQMHQRRESSAAPPSDRPASASSPIKGPQLNTRSNTRNRTQTAKSQVWFEEHPSQKISYLKLFGKLLILSGLRTTSRSPKGWP